VTVVFETEGRDHASTRLRTAPCCWDSPTRTWKITTPIHVTIA